MNNAKQITTVRGKNGGTIISGYNYFRLVFIPTKKSIKANNEVMELNSLVMSFLNSKGYSVGMRNSGSSIHGAKLSVSARGKE